MGNQGVLDGVLAQVGGEQGGHAFREHHTGDSSRDSSSTGEAASTAETSTGWALKAAVPHSASTRSSSLTSLTLAPGRLAATRENLDAMVTLAQRAKAKVLLVGMQMPSNYGPAYVREFSEVFTAVAKAHRIPLVPFFFAGFGEDRSWFQPDGIHPSELAQPKLLDNVWPALERLLPPRKR